MRVVLRCARDARVVRENRAQIASNQRKCEHKTQKIAAARPGALPREKSDFSARKTQIWVYTEFFWTNYAAIAFSGDSDSGSVKNDAVLARGRWQKRDKVHLDLGQVSS